MWEADKMYLTFSCRWTFGWFGILTKSAARVLVPWARVWGWSCSVPGSASAGLLGNTKPLSHMAVSLCTSTAPWVALQVWVKICGLPMAICSNHCSYCFLALHALSSLTYLFMLMAHFSIGLSSYWFVEAPHGFWLPVFICYPHHLSIFALSFSLSVWNLLMNSSSF